MIQISQDCLQFGKSKQHLLLYNKKVIYIFGNKDNMYKKIEKLVVSAGKMMLEASDRIGIKEKTSNSDIVTEYDVKIQQFLIEELSKLYPHARFMGEEGDNAESVSRILHGTAFIIDPIDGTTNFVRNLQKSAVSVALCENGVVTYGCCYIPYSDELFTAEKGKGAFCNGVPLKCGNRDISHSLVSVGTTPYYKHELGEATFGIMYILYKEAMDVRRIGSAVIDLLDVASGKTDLFFEMKLSPWDYAAAGLIVTEAGGVFTDLNGKNVGYSDKHSVIAASKPCYNFFMNHDEITKLRDSVLNIY